MSTKDSLAKGHIVWAFFGRTYRRGIVTKRAGRYVWVTAGRAINTGAPLERRFLLLTVDMTPEPDRFWLGWQDDTSKPEDPDNAGICYSVAGHDRNGKRVRYSGFVGTLQWAHSMVKRFKSHGCAYCIIHEENCATNFDLESFA